MRKSKKISYEPLGKHIRSPLSKKARQKPITFSKSTAKISLDCKDFWNPVISFLGSKIRFEKDKNFPSFLFLTTRNLWAMIMILIYVLYLSNLYSAGINCHFRRKRFWRLNNSKMIIRYIWLLHSTWRISAIQRLS